MKRWSMILVIAVIVTVGSLDAAAQDPEEPILEAYKNHFKKDYLSIGVLMQFVFDYQNERTLSDNNGFSVGNARLQLKGRFDGGFGYYLQTSFTSSPAVLDANMQYEIFQSVTLRIGQFKAPFSKELLISAANTDFIDRARLASVLAPGRQIGIEISGDIAGSTLNYRAGMFNGNGIAGNNNDDGDFLYTGRVTLFPDIFGEKNDDNSFEFGVNAAFSEDGATSIMGGLIPQYNGKRLLLGTDSRLHYGDLMLSCEYVQAKLDPNQGDESTPWGFHATAGYMIVPALQVLMRWDHLDLDNLVEDGSESDLLIWGVNFWPTGVTELQFNYVVNLDDSDIERHRVLVNGQIAF